MSIIDLELARLSDLAVEHLMGALAADESDEYRDLRERYPGFDLLELECAAAALQLAAMAPPDPLPERLRIRLATDAAGFFGPHRRTETNANADALLPARASRAQRRQDLGWWAAAASLAVALIVWINLPQTTTVAHLQPSDPSAAPPSSPAADPSATPASVTAGAPGSAVRLPPLRASAPAGELVDPAAAREQLLAANPFVLHRSWRAGNDPAGRTVSGDVVWDPRTQRGYMRFVGLRRNNPNAEQYQLWIFDARRDERYPIDGGVFDIKSDSGAEVVAIKANLKVGVALMFAVTIERPGGVMVSDRSRIAALANSG